MTSIGFASGLAMMTVVLIGNAVANALDVSARRRRTECEAAGRLIGKPLGARPTFPNPPWAPWLRPDFRGACARLHRPPLLGTSNR